MVRSRRSCRYGAHGGGTQRGACGYGPTWRSTCKGAGPRNRPQVHAPGCSRVTDAASLLQGVRTVASDQMSGYLLLAPYPPPPRPAHTPTSTANPTRRPLLPLELAFKGWRKAVAVAHDSRASAAEIAEPWAAEAAAPELAAGGGSDGNMSSHGCDSSGCSSGCDGGDGPCKQCADGGGSSPPAAGSSSAGNGDTRVKRRTCAPRLCIHVSLADYPEYALPSRHPLPCSAALAPRGLGAPPALRVAQAARHLRGLEGRFAAVGLPADTCAGGDAAAGPEQMGGCAQGDQETADGSCLPTQCNAAAQQTLPSGPRAECVWLEASPGDVWVWQRVVGLLRSGQVLYRRVPDRRRSWDGCGGCPGAAAGARAQADAHAFRDAVVAAEGALEVAAHQVLGIGCDSSVHLYAHLRSAAPPGVQLEVRPRVDQGQVGCAPSGGDVTSGGTKVPASGC